jgi:hypothetical protein
VARRPSVFVRPLSMDEGRKIQKVSRSLKDPVRLRRAIVVMMSGQGQTVLLRRQLPHRHRMKHPVGPVTQPHPRRRLTQTHAPTRPLLPPLAPKSEGTPDPVRLPAAGSP